MATAEAQHAQFSDRDLLFMVGEELKKPLTVIKAMAERKDTVSVALEARRALRTIDNILLYQKVANDQLALQLGPVHVGSTLTNVAHELQPLSLEFGCETEVFIQSGMATVEADASLLQSAIESLWQAVLGLTERPSPVTWRVYKKRGGVRIALVNNSIDTSRIHLGATSLAGISRQPFAGAVGPATDLLAAKGLFAAMTAKLEKVTLDGLPGFAVTLPISKQLSLV